MNTLWQDIRFAVRMLWKSPGFTFVAVLALALGIGVNTAIFSVVNAVLLRPLPYADSDRLVVLNATNIKTGDNQTGTVSPADFLDWRAQSESFERSAVYGSGTVTLSGIDLPEQFAGARVSDEFFDVLNVKPALGRTLLPEEFKQSGNRAAVLSHRLWQRRFGGNPGIIGQTLTLNGTSTTIVGVMPATFKQPASAEVWTPLPSDTGEWRARGSRYLTAVARLKANVTLAQANAEMNTITSRLAEAHPETNTGWAARVVGLQERAIGDVRPALLILLGAVGFVLLVACANVANLLLARATARHKEVAIRAALGATRGRIIRQLLVESLLLAAIGGAFGLLLALWCVDALPSLMPEGLGVPRFDEIGVDAAVLGFTFGVSLLTGLLFGLLPALKASQIDLQQSLKESGRGAGASLQRVRSVLVVAEVALTLILLVGAGLLMKSFLLLQKADPGFDAQNLLTLQIVPPPRKYQQDEQRAAFYRHMLEQVAAVPGVQAAALTSGVPLNRIPLDFPFDIEGRATNPGDRVEAIYSSISADYFRAMNITLQAGREFNERDNREAPNVCVINETMRRRFFAAENPIGRRLTITYLGKPLTHEIVGVVGDAKQVELSDAPNIEIYVPYLQLPWSSTAMVVRAGGDPASLVPSIQRAVWSVDKDQPISGVRTMEQLLAESSANPRFYTLLLGVFALVALLLATIGIYGVMSYSVNSRTHEIGVRMALGAQTRDVLRLIVGHGMMLTLIGVALGLAGAFAVTRVMTNLLYGVSATDPVVFIGIAVLLAVIAFLASYIPARRATKVDPMIALRYE